jgi:hypothetical protein
VSPIFIRPAREQYEHDRLIRFLEPKYKRKFVVGINPGDEQTTPVKLGANTFYPDLVLSDGKRMAGLVEIETGESVNNLEALAQWVPFSRAKVAFHLYVPVQSYDSARRLCEANQVRIGEIWTYRTGQDGFDLVRVHQDAAAAASKAGSKQSSSTKPAKPAVRKSVKPVKASRPAAAKAKPATRAATRPAPAQKKPASRSVKLASKRKR